MNDKSVFVLLCVSSLLTSCDSAAPERPPEPLASVAAFADQSFVDQKPPQKGDIFMCQVAVHGAAPPIVLFLIVKVDSSWGGYGSKRPLHSVDRDRVELSKNGEVWATYNVNREPFTESVTIGSIEYGMDSGRVFLVDFTTQPNQVKQVKTDVQAFARQADFESREEQRLRLKSILEALATQNLTIRQFVTADEGTRSTH